MGIINWGQILENLGVFGLIVGAISWLLKSLGQDTINRKFKAYEKELDLKSNDYQAKLNIEHTQYLKLHEKRLEVMTKLYKTISELDRCMRTLTSLLKFVDEGQTADEQDKEQAQKALDAYISFRTFYEDHKIFFNETNCTLLDKLQEQYWNSWWDRTTKERLGVSGSKFNFENAQKASETLRDHIPPIKEALEKEFRMTLGVK